MVWPLRSHTALLAGASSASSALSKYRRWEMLAAAMVDYILGAATHGRAALCWGVFSGPSLFVFENASQNRHAPVAMMGVGQLRGLKAAAKHGVLLGTLRFGHGSPVCHCNLWPERFPVLG
jgi:hypothetical protein